MMWPKVYPYRNDKNKQIQRIYVPPLYVCLWSLNIWNIIEQLKLEDRKQKQT